MQNVNQQNNVVPVQGRGFSLGAVWDDVQVAWNLFWDKRTPLLSKLIIPLAVLYIISPIDFLPDFFVGLGQLDDITLLITAMAAFLKVSPSALVNEWRLRVQGIDPHAVVIEQHDDQEQP